MKTIFFVSTDFSPAGNNAVKFATQYAAATNSHLAVFHAAHLAPFDPRISEADLEQLRNDTAENQRKDLDQTLTTIYNDLGMKRADANVTVTSKTATFTADTILNAAQEHHADLLIIGTHEEAGLKILDSITSELIFKSETPVLSIPPQCEYKKINTILYASDLKNTANELKKIIPFAIPFNALIEIFHVDFEESETKPPQINSLIQELKYQKIELVNQQHTKHQTKLEEVESYTQTRNPEILVMFPEERSVLDKLFVRSNTEKLAYHARLPLLTFLKSGVGN